MWKKPNKFFALKTHGLTAAVIGAGYLGYRGAKEAGETAAAGQVAAAESSETSTAQQIEFAGEQAELQREDIQNYTEQMRSAQERFGMQLRTEARNYESRQTRAGIGYSRELRSAMERTSQGQRADLTRYGRDLTSQRTGYEQAMRRAMEDTASGQRTDLTDYQRQLMNQSGLYQSDMRGTLEGMSERERADLSTYQGQLQAGGSAYQQSLLDAISQTEEGRLAGMDRTGTESRGYMTAAEAQRLNITEDERSRQDAIAGEYIPAGQRSVAEMEQLAGTDLAFDITQDPGYNFRVSEGTRAIENSAAARGMLLSGGTLKDIGRFTQGLASQEFGNSYGRAANLRKERLGMLSTLSQQGLTAAQQQAGISANLAGADVASVADMGGTVGNYAGATMDKTRGIVDPRASAINFAGTTPDLTRAITDQRGNIQNFAGTTPNYMGGIVDPRGEAQNLASTVPAYQSSVVNPQPFIQNLGMARQDPTNIYSQAMGATSGVSSNYTSNSLNTMMAGGQAQSQALANQGQIRAAATQGQYAAFGNALNTGAMLYGSGAFNSSPPPGVNYQPGVGYNNQGYNVSFV